jgi:hypothetical protein
MKSPGCPNHLADKIADTDCGAGQYDHDTGDTVGSRSVPTEKFRR